MTVQLNWQEMAMSFWIGSRRRLASVQMELRETNGCSRESNAKQFYFNIVGACGECATAKATGRYWPMGINQKKNEADVYPDLQVRTLGKDHYDLIIRKDDPDSFRYVLVLGDPPVLKIAGWIWGDEAKKMTERFFDRGERDEPCYWVPQQALRDPSELVVSKNYERPF